MSCLGDGKGLLRNCRSYINQRGSPRWTWRNEAGVPEASTPRTNLRKKGNDSESYQIQYIKAMGEKGRKHWLDVGSEGKSENVKSGFPAKTTLALLYQSDIKPETTCN